MSKKTRRNIRVEGVEFYWWAWGGEDVRIVNRETGAELHAYLSNEKPKWRLEMTPSKVRAYILQYSFHKAPKGTRIHHNVGTQLGDSTRVRIHTTYERSNKLMEEVITMK